MITFIAIAASRARSRTVVLLCGVAAVVTTAALAGSVATTGQARVSGSLTAAFRPAYDLLVRPTDDVSSYEHHSGLVRDNFLGNLFGGISLRQLAAVREIPGVSAAPIENIGYVLAAATVFIPFHPPSSGAAHQLFRVRASFELPGGAVSWGTAYVYVARKDRFVSSGQGSIQEVLPGDSNQPRVCGSQSTPPTASTAPSPYTLGKLDGYITCYSEVTPTSGSFPTGTVRIPVAFDIPMLLAAVDPEVEASWFELNRAMVRGRYLRPDATGRLVRGTSLGTVEAIPVIVSSHAYLVDRLRLTTALVAAANGPSLPEKLATAPATHFAAKLRARGREAEVSETGAAAYRAFLRGAMAGNADASSWPVPEYWVTSQPCYHSTGHDAVAVAAVRPSESVWRATPGWGDTASISESGGTAYLGAPPGNQQDGYVPVSVRDLRSGTGPDGTGRPAVVSLDVVGEFDPARIPGYRASSRVPLETFRPPVAEAADASTERTLGRRVLGPTTELGGYIAQPPLLLTSLAAAHSFYADRRYDGSVASRPISAILVRLSGSLGTGTASRTRIGAAAEAIRAATGLSVDIMDGSSPTAVLVTLDRTRGPAGGPLLLREAWTESGVTYDILAALDLKTVGLVGLSAIAGLLFVAGVAASSVRGRRSELTVLVGLGWRRSDLLRAVLGEIVMVSALGAAAGALATVTIAALGSIRLEGDLVALTTTLVPIAATLAALVPLSIGTRHEVIASPTSVRRRGGRRSSRFGLALATVTAAPGRALVASGSLAVGIAAVDIVVTLERAFARDLVATRTVLGTSVDLHVKELDVASAAAILLLGLVAVVTTVLSGNEERLRAQALLGATGWARRDLLSLVLVETIVIAGAGVMLGLAAASAVTADLGAPLTSSLGPALISAGGSLAVVLTSVVVPSHRQLRLGLAARAS